MRHTSRYPRYAILFLSTANNGTYISLIRSSQHLFRYLDSLEWDTQISVLTIHNITSADYGNYSCRAKNSLGLSEPRTVVLRRGGMLLCAKHYFMEILMLLYARKLKKVYSFPFLRLSIVYDTCKQYPVSDYWLPWMEEMDSSLLPLHERNPPVAGSHLQRASDVKSVSM